LSRKFAGEYLRQHTRRIFGLQHGRADWPAHDVSSSHAAEAAAAGPMGTTAAAEPTATAA